MAASEMERITRNMRRTLNLFRIQGVSFPITRADTPFGENFPFVPLHHFCQSHHWPSIHRRKYGIGIPGGTSELDQTTS